MIIRAPQLDWNVIEAARNNAHTLRSQAAHEVGAAVANAVHDATGLRLTELPMSPPRVLSALQSQKR